MAGREGQIFVRLDSLSLGGPQGIDVAEVHCCSAQAKAPAIHRFLWSVRGENALMRHGTGQSAGFVRSSLGFARDFGCGLKRPQNGFNFHSPLLAFASIKVARTRSG